MAPTADFAWHRLLGDILAQGSRVEPRGKPTLELLAHTTVVDMSFPIVSEPRRELGYKFMAAEAYWILTGDNRVETIAPYSKAISQFSDDGVRFFGAYGPKVMEQLTYVVEALLGDPSTRQAVMTIWRPNPPVTKDVPCSISAQWVIRDGCLHCFDTMRSSDAWLGWPYDVFNFSMISYTILSMLRQRGMHELEIGNLYLTAGSAHLYEPQWTAAAVIADEKPRSMARLDLESYLEHSGAMSSPENLMMFLDQARISGIDKLMGFDR